MRSNPQRSFINQSVFFRLVKNYWKDSVFVYGLGLVYFKYNSFRWATVAFQQVLYIDPGFSRCVNKTMFLIQGVFLLFLPIFSTKMKNIVNLLS